MTDEPKAPKTPDEPKRDDVLYPVEGRLLAGVPAAPVKVPSAAVADRLIRTGAYSPDNPGGMHKKDAVPLDDVALAALDFYDSPISDEDAAKDDPRIRDRTVHPEVSAGASGEEN